MTEEQLHIGYTVLWANTNSSRLHIQERLTGRRYSITRIEQVKNEYSEPLPVLGLLKMLNENHARKD